MVNDSLFSEVLDFPNVRAQQRYTELVGVDDIKQRLVGEALTLLDHQRVTTWSERHHSEVIRAANELSDRPPLIILAGDVGTGKTELAETFLDAVTRQMNVSGALYALSLAARGDGVVGQMSSLIGNAFSEVIGQARAGSRQGRPSKINALLIDEGDALAQSRELAQMHHEDRAGVNALIKGIDSLKRHSMPVLVILCTNRLSALDPAVRRRAAYMVTLQRPNEEQRRVLLCNLLEGVMLSDSELEQLVSLTGATDHQPYGYTYSDIRQRLIPEAVMLAISKDVPLSVDVLMEAVKRVPPTRPFMQETEAA